MTDLVARTGRHQQRYKAGCRLVAGCIPFRYVDNDCGVESKKNVEVLMINSQSGRGFLFPKGFLGDYDFKSKSHQDELSPDGLCRATMFALLVKEELDSWPEQSTRQRRWLSTCEAIQYCRYPWVQKALEEGFTKWHAEYLMHSSGEG